MKENARKRMPEKGNKQISIRKKKSTEFYLLEFFLLKIIIIKCHTSEKL
jgi:hypothetical protein